VLSRRPEAGLVDVARAGGLTRTTVYAHFASREELLEELLRRAVAATSQAIDDGDPTSGPAEEALLRVMAASWREVAEHAGLVDTVSRSLGERAAELHAPVRDRLLALLRRGRHQGAFRSDVPERWLVTVYFALVHAAGREVAAGARAAADAERDLARSILGVFTPPTGSPPTHELPPD
jgi:AcrR family transcriptional regulator